jgi:hypothetical protein
MGDVQHVIEFISSNYSLEGVECQAEGKGVLWVTPPPNFRDINLFYTELSALENVSAIDQETNGNQVRIKIMVSDLPRKSINVDLKVPSWLQSYLNSNYILMALSALTLAYYGKYLVGKAEEWYLTASDE